TSVHAGKFAGVTESPRNPSRWRAATPEGSDFRQSPLFVPSQSWSRLRMSAPPRRFQHEPYATPDFHDDVKDIVTSPSLGLVLAKCLGIGREPAQAFDATRSGGKCQCGEGDRARQVRYSRLPPQAACRRSAP